ncbi:dihydrolipoyl dehydrogenase [Oceanobacillus oncorhynchi subsp. incaldanensis]|uniref:dihydrolipoyl dehydrogenase n=1 Tax=Oceanobacillus oncorhynchi TaxID=545501 RepID=UPI001B2B7C33|nr:dihydrolipoyl dehydrogenase [Oceanobacillus oncorhynchi]GIO20344.1 dihydrolipoyl dehydrogenase [Oceanobacillus oncorhynchi subsp. incaldanensis]
MEQYDVIIVGGGPAGYVAAIRAAKNGKKIALVEKSYLGGTCLNRGCIPSKTLLRHTEVIEDIKSADAWGIKVSNLTFSFDEMLNRKDKVIETLRGGIKHLLQSGKIEVYDGEATIDKDKQVKVAVSKNDILTISADNILVATGSKPAVPPIEGVDKVHYHTTDTIFNLTEIPNSITIIGGGVIGVEMANIFSSLNVKVTVVEMGDRLIPSEDKDASKALLKSLKKKGINVLTKHQVLSISEENGVKRMTTSSKKEGNKTIESSEVLIAVGRKPNLSAVDSLDLKKNGPFIEVDDYLETSIQGIFAAGDVIGRLQLAHVASEEGLMAIENMDNKNHTIDYQQMPRCIYTKPEVASIGYNEQELIDKNIVYRIGKYNFSGNGKALAMGETEGFLKVLVDSEYGEVLGVTMIGSRVTEMIGQAGAYLQLEGTVDELAGLTQAHPSLSEGIMEVANSLIGKGIHVS